MSVETEKLAAAWRKMVGIALLWVALAALIATSRTSGPQPTVLLALLGFAAFAAGLWLFAEGVKRSIVAAVALKAPALFG